MADSRELSSQQICGVGAFCKSVAACVLTIWEMEFGAEGKGTLATLHHSALLGLDSEGL